MAQQKVPPSSSVPPSQRRSPIPPAQSIAKRPPAIDAKPVVRKASGMATVPFWMGLLASIIWVGVVVLIVAKSGPAHTFGGLPLVNWAIGVTAIASPVALIWMVTAYLQRAADIQTIAEPLRRQLSLITGESGVAEARIRRFNQAMREQLDMLKNIQTSGQGDLSSMMDRINQHRIELERFEGASVQQVKEIQEIIRRNMQQIEHMMDDKFTMMRVLDDKMVQSGDGVARQIESVREQVVELLGEVEGNAGRLVDALSRAMQDSKKLSETASAQEESLSAAAGNAADILGDMSSKIDMSIARFLERAGVAREEAEHLANTLEAQTRSLDEFSSVLPTRVSETENVLRGVADRLYSSEQVAREQTMALTERMAQQLDTLQGFVERFANQFSIIDGGLEKRRDDLDTVLEKMSGAGSDFVTKWEASVNALQDRTTNTLMRYEAVEGETRKTADVIVAQMADTALRYESVVAELRRLSAESHVELKGMTEQIGTHLSEFDRLREVAAKAGAEIEARASAATQNLQYVLERLLSAREATQDVGDRLSRDLSGAVDRNESLISRLNEAAQMSVHAIGIATESFAKQEGDVLQGAKAHEQALTSIIGDIKAKSEQAAAAMRAQTENLVALLSSAQEKIGATEGRLDAMISQSVPAAETAIRRIDMATGAGIDSLGRYGDNVQDQLSRLQSFNDRVTGMGGDIARIAQDAVESIEQIQSRYAAARVVQEEQVRDTLLQFADLSDRLHREVAGLEGDAGKAVIALQDAASKVGEQSYQMLQTSENTSSRVQQISSQLQVEAEQIRATLQKQADDLAADMVRAEKNFATLGDALQQRTEAAYVLLDRVAAHYNETTRAAAQEMDGRAARLSTVTTEAQGRVDALSQQLGRQLDQLASGVMQIDQNVEQVGVAGAKAMQSLTGVQEKLTMTSDAAVRNAQNAISKLDECATALARQSSSLADASQSSAILLQQAGNAFGDQATRLRESSQDMDQQLRQMSATTATMAEQAAYVRTGMEQHNQRLLAQLSESVNGIEASSNKLQQAATTAGVSLDQIEGRFVDTVEKSVAKLSSGRDALVEVAGTTETTLAALGANVTQQTASLSILSDQIVEQQRSLSASNENQRQQLVDLFEKLGSAHGQASDVAERTITRLRDTLNEIEQQLGLLGDHSQTAVGNVRMASSSFAEQAGGLIQNAREAEQQARTVLTVTSALTEQARNLRESLQGESERAGEVLGALVSKLANGGSIVREVGANTEMSLTSLNVTIDQQSQNLQSSMQQIAERQRSLTTALDAQRDVMNGLLNRMTLAQDETVATAERTVARLAEGTQTMARSIEQLDQQSQKSLVSIEAANNVFAQEANVLNAHAREAEHQARNLVAVAGTMEAQVKVIRESIAMESTETMTLLTGLLGKLTEAGGQVGEVSEVAKSSLTSLQGVMQQQTEDVAQSMQQIMDKQKNLTGALSEQRDMMSSLLSRVAVAQDESAAAAERTVVRLADGAQQIIRQLELIGTQAQGTLASVQAAGRGFADEAGSLGMQAQQAEQHMRGVVSVMGGMQDQASRLREQMQGEVSRIVAEINGVIAQLDSANAHLRQQGTDAIHTMDQSALQFATLAKHGAEAMQKQASIMAEAASLSEARMADTGEKMKSHINLVTEMADKTEVQARQLADTAEYATLRLGNLRTTIVDTNQDSESAINRTTQRLDEVKAQLQDSLHRLSQLSLEAVGDVADAGERLMTQSDALRANLALSESALESAATLVRDESVQLPATLDRGAGVIQVATQTLKEQAANAEQALVGVADRFIGVTTLARDGLVDEMRRVGMIADNADKLLRDLTGGLNAQVSAIQNSAAALNAEQKAIVEKSGQSVAEMEAASLRMSSLRQDAAITAEKLAAEFAAMDGRVSGASEKLEKASQSLSRNMLSMAEIAQQAEGAMLGASSGMRDQLERIRSGLQAQVDDINRGLMQITAQLERTGNTLRSTTAGTVADVERIAQRFNETGRDAAQVMDERTTRMRTSTEDVTRLLSGFGDQLDVLLDRLAMAGDGIKRQEGGIVNQLQNALEHLGAVAERLEQGRNLAGSVSGEVTSRLAEVVDAMEGKIKTLTANSQTAAGIMRGVGQVYGEQSAAISHSFSDVHGQVEGMNKSIETMQQRVDRMRVSLKLQSEEMMQSLQQIMSQLSATGDALGDTVDTILQERAAEELKKIG